jgi:mono/diheme cytochrome c family protein
VSTGFRGMIMVGSVVLLGGCGDGAGRGAASDGTAAANASNRPPGEAAYLAVCANCHLEHGRGMAPAYRSLVGSAWATGDADRSIAIVLYGVQGPVVDERSTYHTAMLAFGSGAPMSDTAVAAVVTYMRTSWGNTASAVTVADVARVKARYAGRTKGFTQAELDAMGR